MHMGLQRLWRKTFSWLISVTILQAAASGAQKLPDVGPADSRIVAALRQVLPSHIQANIDKLVSFQTRSTLSAQDAESIKAGHGIGAAREWIKAEFESYSRACGGCLEVKATAFWNRPPSEFPRQPRLPMSMRFSKERIQTTPSGSCLSPATTIHATAIR